MNVRDLMKNTPNTILAICATVVFVAILGSLVFLASSGKDSTSVENLVNTFLNFGSLLLGGGAFVAAGSAARSAEKAVQQTNGQLDTRIQKAISQALETQQARNTSIPDDFR